ncbi:MAG: manganese-binding transcriptional regulator MntR [Rhodothalassiaceae bacterium]
MVKAQSDPAQRAAAFKRIREAHQTEVAEDYVELIEDLIDAHGEARLVDLARYLGISQATAAKTVQRLQREGLVDSRPYRSIFLTQAGRDLAAMARARHQVIYEFLCAIGIDPETAASDAEGMEHHVSEATLDALKRLTAEAGKQSQSRG